MSKNPRWVRLANGEIEPEEGVGSIMVCLRQIETSHPAQFLELAKFSTEQLDELSPTAISLFKKHKLVNEEVQPIALWDDVKDVLDSALEWKGNHVHLGSSPLHKDQTNVVPPTED